MEYCEETLANRITETKQKNQKFPSAFLIEKIFTLISSYAAMESIGICHKDIKPQNILINSKNQLKIVDFNVSEIVKKGFSDSQNWTGTEGFMAPELKENKRIENFDFCPFKADVFSLGIIILQMVSLEDLFTLNLKENHLRLLGKVENVEFEWVKSLLFKMLDLNPNNRPPFAELLKYVPYNLYTVIN